MTSASLLGFLLSAFGAEVIGTMAGFGAATVLTPVASWFLDIKTAVAVVACFHLFGNASRLVFFGRHIAWRIAGAFRFMRSRSSGGRPPRAVSIYMTICKPLGISSEFGGVYPT